MSIRDATPADAPVVAEIYAHHVLHGTGSFEETPPPAQDMADRMSQIAERGLPWLLAEDETGAVLGYAYAMPYRPRSGYRFSVEDAVYVAPHAQRRGVGRALLDALLERLRAQGYRQVIASIGDSANTGSIALHAACGFEHRGRLVEVGFKHQRWLDVVWMQKTLHPPLVGG